MKIIQIAGIDIDLHWTFLVLLALILITGSLDEVAIVLVLFASVVLHELSHSLVARFYKINVRRIVLLPIGGMSMIDEFSMPAHTELMVAAAGPAFSFALAASAYLIASISPFPDVTAFAGFVGDANLILCVFNLIPAIPMDGGRVWRALRQRKRSFLAATKEAVALSRSIVFILLTIAFLVAILFDAWSFLFWNGLIALFVYFGSGMELDAALFKTASEGITVRDAMRREITCAGSEDTLLDAFELACGAKARNILLISRHGFGVVPLGAFATVPHSEWGRMRLKSIATVTLRCSPGDDVLSVWKKMRAHHVELAPVMEKKKLIGVISEADIERLIYLKRLALIS